jgi:predicted small lipoprotein YifL
VESTWIRKGMRTAVLLSMLALGACGQKGPLVLPMVAAPSSDHSTQ